MTPTHSSISPLRCKVSPRRNSPLSVDSSSISRPTRRLERQHIPSCGCLMRGIRGLLASGMVDGAEEVSSFPQPFTNSIRCLSPSSSSAVPVADIGLNGVAQGYAGYGTNTGKVPGIAFGFEQRPDFLSFVQVTIRLQETEPGAVLETTMASSTLLIGLCTSPLSWRSNLRRSTTATPTPRATTWLARLEDVKVSRRWPLSRKTMTVSCKSGRRSCCLHSDDA